MAGVTGGNSAGSSDGARVTLAPELAHVDLGPVVVDPPDRRDGQGGVAEGPGEPEAAALARLGPERAVLTAGDGVRHAVLLLPPEPTADGRGALRHEVVVDGWRVVVEVESERRAALRARATRGRDDVAHAGPTEIRAVIPGRVLGVAVGAGDVVEAGQQLLVVEAMKMQNELRAPREGTVERVVVVAGQTIELGDLLVVLA